MAVTKSKKTLAGPSALQALTAAALVLPGLVQAPAHAAADDEFSFQYGRYQEGERDLGNVKSNFKPITVDSLQSSGNVSLTDRIKFGFNFIQDTWSGATPITTAPSVRQGNQEYKQFGTVAGASPFIKDGNGGIVYFDSNFNPLKSYQNLNTGEQTSLGIDRQLVHTMVMASPETRKEGNFRIGYEWDEAAVSAGGGISNEHDYESRFTNLGLRLDFNQKRTTLDMSASYANSYTSARIDHDVSPYVNTVAYTSQIVALNEVGGPSMIKGNREDWGGNVNLTQVVNKDALAKVGVGFTHSAGYLENPYKYVTAFFVEPTGGALGELSSTIPYVGQVKAFMEQRPNNRNQVNLSAGWVQYVSPLDAALHFDYKFFHDDWGIDAHTFEGDWVQPLGAGWTITPRVRYYSQSSADFYYPYLIVKGAGSGAGSSPRDNAKLPTQTFSSDHRLSGYGALSGGVMVSKQFAKGLRLDAGFEYYTHKGSWRLDGEGEGAYADFDYYVANASLNVNLAQLGRSLSEGGHEHHHHHHDHGAPLPAGVMFGHMMEQADSVMVGYRYMYSRQDGGMLHGEQLVSDQTVIAQGCTDNAVTCRTVPAYMDMHMHMLDIMYAPTDWLNLMLMPQFMDMNMDVRPLSGIAPVADSAADHIHGGHQTGGIGDTGMYALFKVFGEGGHHVNLTLGVSAPTGDVGIRLKPRMHRMDGGYIHYGMQLGSGTWDFKPSVTYTGRIDDWSWGAQVSGTKRMDNHNESGYVLGDMLQTTAWGSYNVLDWLAASVRGVYTTQGSIKGGFNAIPGDCSLNHTTVAIPCADVNPKYGSMDQPGSYGGHYWDVGFGLNAMVPDGKFAGHSFGVEWLQPVMDDVNGYQLERSGTLNATWTYMF